MATKKKAVVKKATAKKAVVKKTPVTGPATTIRLIERKYPCHSEYKVFLRAIGGRPLNQREYFGITAEARGWAKARVKADDPILLSDIGRLTIVGGIPYSLTPKQWVDWIIGHECLIDNKGARMLNELKELDWNGELAMRVFQRCALATVKALLVENDDWVESDDD